MKNFLLTIFLPYIFILIMFTRFFSKIDELLASIPLKVRKLIVFFSVSAWISTAFIVSIITFQRGMEDAPVMGEDLYLSEVKEKIQKNQNLKKKSTIILPDLNDLVKREFPLEVQSVEEVPAKSPLQKNKNIQENRSVGILTESDSLLFPQKKEPGVQTYTESRNSKYQFLSESEKQKKKKNKIEILPIEN